MAPIAVETGATGNYGSDPLDRVRLELNPRVYNF